MKNQRKLVNFSIFVFIFILLIGNLTEMSLNSKNKVRINDLSMDFNQDEKQLKKSQIIKGSAEPYIFIEGDSTGEGAHNWTWAITQGICSGGSGTYLNPYIIENLEIEDPNDEGGILKIIDSDVYFIIRNCNFNNSYGYDSYGIMLNNVHNGTITNIVCFNNSVGIEAIGCENCSIFDNTLKNNEYGIEVTGTSGKSSNNVNITANIIENSGYGIYLTSFTHNITILQNSMIQCGIILSGDQAELSSHKIDNTNTVNGKIAYYYVDKVGLKANNFINAGQIILVNCSYSEVINLDVSNSSRGFALYYSENNTIFNSNASNCYAEGIYLEYSKNNTISGINASYNGYDGIKVHWSDMINISICTSNYNGQSGILLSDSDDDILKSNSIFYNEHGGIKFDYYCKNINLSQNIIIKWGLQLTGFKEDITTYDIDKTNTVNGKPIYYYANKEDLNPQNFTNAGQIFLFSCNDSIILNQNISIVDYGFDIRYCKNITVQNCNSSLNTYGFYIYETREGNFSFNILNNNSYGILLQICNYFNITGNEMNYNIFSGLELYEDGDSLIFNNSLNENGRYGIYINYGNNNVFKNNSLIKCGLYIQGYAELSEMANNSIDNTNKVNEKILYYYIHQTGLSNSHFINAGQVILVNCSYSMISNLNITQTSVGMAIYHSGNNTFYRNNLSSNLFNGFEFFYSSDNNLTQNICQKNSDFGLYLDDNSKYNTIYTNFFIENGDNAFGKNATNKWDYKNIGNYWDDYSGADKNDDGFGDTPYIVTSYGFLPIINIYDNYPIWDDGSDYVSTSDDGKSSEELAEPLIQTPGYNLYLIFGIITIISIVLVKKLKF